MLTPGESDRLLLHTQAQLAQRRRDRGLRLNIPEATALIADAACEWARDGLDLPEVISRCRTLLTADDVLPEVPELLSEVRVEARFDDGPRLVIVADPFGAAEPPAEPDAPAAGDLWIRNEASTPIGISSHIHLAEVNPRLRLDRSAAFGRRLGLPAGDSIWLEPGEEVAVPTTPIRGARVAIGTTGVVDGPLDDDAVRERALATLRACGYLDVVEGEPLNSNGDDAVRHLMARVGPPHE